MRGRPRNQKIATNWMTAAKITNMIWKAKVSTVPALGGDASNGSSALVMSHHTNRTKRIASHHFRRRKRPKSSSERSMDLSISSYLATACILQRRHPHIANEGRHTLLQKGATAAVH